MFLIHRSAALVLVILTGCGGGGAAIDAVLTEPNPSGNSPDNTPGGPTGTVVTTPGTTFSPATVTIAQNGTVTWQISGNTHNVTFGSAKPPGGDIPNTAPGSNASRTFPNPGTYPYDCTLHSGMPGTIIVQGTGALVFTAVAVSPSTPSIAIGSTVQLSATPRDQNGSAMTGLPAATWSTSNASVASVAGGTVTGVAAGTATITATIVSGGVTRSGTATVTVTAASPSNLTVTTPGESFSPQSVFVTPGATVTWQFSGSRHNVTFGTLKPAGGDIPDTEPGNAVARVFSTAGSYPYQCTRHSGMTGTVNVGTSAPPPGETPSGTLIVLGASGFNPERVEIAPGGSVTFEFAAGADGIVFDDEAPPGGNIPQSPQGSKVTRTFPAEGDYDFHSLRNPRFEGRVRVR